MSVPGEIKSADSIKEASLESSVRITSSLCTLISLHADGCTDLRWKKESSRVKERERKREREREKKDTLRRSRQFH